MAPAINPQPDSPSATASPGTDAATPARRARLGDNPMQTVLGAAVVGLLIFSLTSNRSRIARLEDAVHAGFAAQDAKIDAGFAAQDAKIDAGFAAQDAKIDAGFAALDDRIDKLDLKLTALIAALNKAEEVDAAIEGRLLAPDTAESSP